MLPRVRAVTLSSYVEVARFVGLEPYELLRRANIDPLTLEEPENWLSARAATNLLEWSAAESSRPDFAILMAECRTFASIGPISLILKHEKSLRHILRRMAEFRKHMNDIFDLSVEESGGVACIHWTVAPKYAEPQNTTLIMAIGHRALTDSMRGIWRPECAHFSFDRPDDVGAFRRYFQCDLEFSSQFNGLSCPASRLDERNPWADESLARHAERLLKLVPIPRETVSDRAQHALYLLLPGGNATVETVARNLGFGARTLQRELDKEGLSFAKLLNETRRDLALRYLCGQSQPVTEIAALTGYSSISAFSRWFAQEFGVPPLEWRNQSARPRMNA